VRRDAERGEQNAGLGATRSTPSIAVVGVGLIGGSIGLAARERLGAHVAGVDCSEQALRAAVERGALDLACGSVVEAVQSVDAAFVAVPVGAIVEVVGEVLAAAPPECIVTDVGSTKRAVVTAHDDPRFVGGHPLAGAESSGVEHARADLFEGAAWYLTPTATTSGMVYERLHRLLHAVGARPAAIDAEAHDTILATVSHLPHVLANVLVSQAASALSSEGERLPATGPSFRDATRVAGASNEIWTDIYMSNGDVLASVIDRVVERLGAVRAALASRDADWIAEWNDAAAGDRRRLLEAQLAGGELSELRVSVPNRPGVVAQLALELGRGGVNITDMALHPAPHMRDGVIALWIAGADETARAVELIGSLGFPVATV
jgi:prephenate dehydrogenase